MQEQLGHGVGGLAAIRKDERIIRSVKRIEAFYTALDMREVLFGNIRRPCRRDVGNHGEIKGKDLVGGGSGNIQGTQVLDRVPVDGSELFRGKCLHHLVVQIDRHAGRQSGGPKDHVIIGIC